MKKIYCLIGLIALLFSNGSMMLSAGATNPADSGVSSHSASTDAGWVDFTFVAWVYWHGGDVGQRIFDFGSGTEAYMFLSPSSGSGVLRFAMKPMGGSETVLDHTAPLPANRWVQVAVTLSGDTASLYLDGSLLISGSMPPNPADILAANFWLGRSHSDTYFDGFLDEVAVFDRALSATDIAAVYAGGWAAQHGKVLALHLDDIPAFDGNIVWDASGQRHQGSLLAADPANKAVTGQLGGALSFDGIDDYVALDPNLPVNTRIVIDTDAMTIERDGDNNPLAFKGIPFLASTSPDGIAKFSLVGDLTLADGEILTGVGSKAISLYVAGNVNIAPGALVDVSAAGTVPGPGGGKAGMGSPGGKGGQGSYSGSDFSFAAWVFWNGGSSTWQRIFDFGWDINRFMLLTPKSSDNKLSFIIKNSALATEQQLSYASPLPTNQWVHVAVTLAGDTGTLYLNGGPVASGTISLNPADVFGPNMRLGRSQYGTDPFFYGLMDEVGMFDRALSEIEIRDIYRTGWVGMRGQLLGLHLDENPASNNQTLADSSGRIGQLNYAKLLTGDSNDHAATGMVGGALSFDGSNDYVDIPYLYAMVGELFYGGAGGAQQYNCLMPQWGNDGVSGGYDATGGIPGTAGENGGGSPGGDGVNSPAGGGVVLTGGSGGVRGDGGAVQISGGEGGDGGDALEIWEGENGGNGADGGPGLSGHAGENGGDSAGGLNTGADLVISGGGGGGGGRAGSGGGAGGQGTSGAGGGGGGSGVCCVNFFCAGLAGGNGGMGGKGGSSGAGGDGGASGPGGAGGGALEIVALGDITLSGNMIASGGAGSSIWSAGQPGMSGLPKTNGTAGAPGGNNGWDHTGGNGGNGGNGGDGAAGAPGGNGGTGGGGAGGTIKLTGFYVNGAGSGIDLAGGLGGSAGGNDGGQGRFILGETFPASFAGTVSGAYDADLRVYS